MTKQTGDMYEWVTRTWNPVGGECPINCPYCYVKAMKRFPTIGKKYSGPPRLTGPWPRFKKGETVFVCSCTDLFAMPGNIVNGVLMHCLKYGLATYVLQTKKPWMFGAYWYQLPTFSALGTTIESDMDMNAQSRLLAMREVSRRGQITFITVEPVMRFTSAFAQMLIDAKPSFVNIGADSKRGKLPEPTADEVRGLIAKLRAAGIEVRD
jgi:protein gp37